MSSNNNGEKGSGRRRDGRRSNGKGESSQPARKASGRSIEASSAAAPAQAPAVVAAPQALQQPQRILMRGISTASIGASPPARLEKTVSLSSLDSFIGTIQSGTIISMKKNFGFIQPIFAEGQVFIHEDEFYEAAEVGDRVSFVVKQQSKGFLADNVNYINENEFTAVVSNVEGTIVRTPERHRSECGLIEFTTTTNLPRDLVTRLNRNPVNCIAYSAMHVLSASASYKLDRGDLVEFSVSCANSTPYYFATNIRLKQMKRDRDRERTTAETIERMLQAGAIRELGIVTTIKNKEYGFIRAQDRKDEIYFRYENASSEEDTMSSIREGTEVEFFVVAEMVKGKLSDRAIHLRPIPRGTVCFEEVIARDVFVTVIVEPGGAPEEIPGTAKLFTPLAAFSTTAAAAAKNETKIKEVDVWGRCIPDEMTLHSGDILKVNVHYYRPEKLYFVRGVSLITPFPLGRDTGSVVVIKDVNGFGFIASELRKVDVYFRLNQVLNKDGSVMAKASVNIGLNVSFDVIPDGNDKLKAVRVKVEDDETTTDKAATKTTNRYIMRENIFGKVIRSTTTSTSSKKDSIGLIAIQPELWKELADLEYLDTQVQINLQIFLTSSMPSVTLYSVPIAMKRLYATVIDKLFADSLVYEYGGPVGVGDITGGIGKNLKITKKSATTANSSASAAATAAATSEANHNKDNHNNITTMNNPSKDGYTIPYSLGHYLTDSWGPLGNDMEVIFNLAFDPVKFKKIAVDIRLTDEACSDAPGTSHGIIDVLIEKGEKLGFIRVIPTFEKLFWHTSSFLDTTSIAAAKQGSEVSFIIRRRGGMRCATNITLQPNTLNKLVTLPDIVTAIVVDNNKAVIINTSESNVLKDLFADMIVLGTRLLESQQLMIKNGWEKSKLPSAATAAIASPATTAAAAASEQEGSLMEQEDKSTSAVMVGKDEVEMLHTAAAAAATVNATDGPVNELPQGRVEYHAKYFPHLQCDAIPIEASEAYTGEVKAGDIVRVRVTVNWSHTDPGQVIHHVTIIGHDTTMNAVRKRGQIMKLKSRFRGLSLAGDRENFNVVDFTEIDAVTTDNHFERYYCEWNELKTAVSSLLSSDNNVQVGDYVEFFVVSTIPAIAFGVKLLPKVVPAPATVMTNKDQSIFQSGKGPGINEKLKANSAAAVNLISMAKGPPTNETIGFEPGWRPVDSQAVASLPWASILPVASFSSSGNSKGKSTAAAAIPAPVAVVAPSITASATAAAPAPPGLSSSNSFKADSKPATLTKSSSMNLPAGLLDNLTPEQIELILDGKAEPPPGVTPAVIAEAKKKRQSGDKDGKCAIN